jgi:hypothetical protein
MYTFLVSFTEGASAMTAASDRKSLATVVEQFA